MRSGWATSALDMKMLGIPFQQSWKPLGIASTALDGVHEGLSHPLDAENIIADTASVEAKLGHRWLQFLLLCLCREPWASPARSEERSSRTRSTNFRRTGRRFRIWLLWLLETRWERGSRMISENTIPTTAERESMIRAKRHGCCSRVSFFRMRLRSSKRGGMSEFGASCVLPGSEGATSRGGQSGRA